MRRAGISLRLYTGDDEQTEENQRLELREFLEDEGGTLVEEWVDHESGCKDRKYLDMAEFRKWKERADRSEFEPDDSIERHPVMAT